MDQVQLAAERIERAQEIQRLRPSPGAPRTRTVGAAAKSMLSAASVLNDTYLFISLIPELPVTLHLIF